jgi:hypothetical protein
MGPDIHVLTRDTLCPIAIFLEEHWHELIKSHHRFAFSNWGEGNAIDCFLMCRKTGDFTLCYILGLPFHPSKKYQGILRVHRPFG